MENDGFYVQLQTESEETESNHFHRKTKTTLWTRFATTTDHHITYLYGIIKWKTMSTARTYAHVSIDFQWLVIEVQYKLNNLIFVNSRV